MSGVRLTPEEIRELAGGLKLPRCQLRKLREHGYWRAWLGTDGQVVLERAHYEAVAAGALPPTEAKGDTAPRPKLRAI